MTNRTRGRRAATVLLCAAAASAALVATGCGSSDDSATDSAAAKPADVAPPPNVKTARFETVTPGSGKGLKLGYISAGEAVTFNHLVTQSMQREAKVAGAQLVTCDSQGDSAKALDCAKNLKTQQVDGYLLYQVAADAAPQICAAGPQVPVIAVSIPQKPCQKSFLGVSDRSVGYAAGKALGLSLKQRFDCKYDAYVSVEYTAVGQPNTDRMGGYADGLASVCGPIKNERKLDAATTDDARKQFADVLTTLPGQKRIVAVGIADFVIQGVLAAAKTAGRGGDVYVSAQGADPSAHCAIKNDPQWLNDAAYLPEKWGQIGIPNLIRLIRHKPVPAELNVPFAIVDGANIAQHYPLTQC